ncbi:MAG: alpha-amylase, partial [Deltaproteobacteria bacterium]
RHPDFFLLGEVYGGAAHDDYLLEYLSGDEMDACFDFGFSGSALSYFVGRMRTVAFDHWLRQRDHFPEGFVTSPYLDSHDEPGFLFRAKGRKEILRLAAALQMTVIGIPTIYYGDEIGRIGGKWPENRSDMPWGAEQDRELFAFYQRLITARRKHPVFGRGRHEALVIEPDAYAFLRYDPSDGAAAITALNRSAEETPLEIPLPEFLAGKSTWLDEMSGAHLSSEGGRLSLSLPPFGVAILAPVAADAMTSQRSARSAGRL